MKPIIGGMSAAAAIVVFQLAGFAAWRAEPPMYLAPIDAPALVHEHA